MLGYVTANYAYSLQWNMHSWTIGFVMVVACLQLELSLRQQGSTAFSIAHTFSSPAPSNQPGFPTSQPFASDASLPYDYCLIVSNANKVFLSKVLFPTLHLLHPCTVPPPCVLASEGGDDHDPRRRNPGPA